MITYTNLADETALLGIVFYLLQAYNPVEAMAVSSQVMNSQNYK